MHHCNCTYVKPKTNAKEGKNKSKIVKEKIEKLLIVIQMLGLTKVQTQDSLKSYNACLIYID